MKNRLRINIKTINKIHPYNAKPWPLGRVSVAKFQTLKVLKRKGFNMNKGLLCSVLLAFAVGSSLQGMEWLKEQIGKAKEWAKQKEIQQQIPVAAWEVKEEGLATQSPLINKYTEKLQIFLNIPQAQRLLSFDEVINELIKINDDLSTLYEELKEPAENNSFNDLQPLYEYRDNLEALYNSLPKKHFEESAAKKIQLEFARRREATESQKAEWKKKLIFIANDLGLLKKLDIDREKPYFYESTLVTIDGLRNGLNEIRNNFDVIESSDELVKIYNPQDISQDLDFLDNLSEKISKLQGLQPKTYTFEKKETKEESEQEKLYGNEDSEALEPATEEEPKEEKSIWQRLTSLWGA